MKPPAERINVHKRLHQRALEAQAKANKEIARYTINLAKPETLLNIYSILVEGAEFSLQEQCQPQDQMMHWLRQCPRPSSFVANPEAIATALVSLKLLVQQIESTGSSIVGPH